MPVNALEHRNLPDRPDALAPRGRVLRNCRLTPAPPIDVEANVLGLRHFAQRISRLSPERRLAYDLAQRADAARDAGRVAEAAILYGEAARLAPKLAWIHIQAGNMNKEVRDFDRARTHYDHALSLAPADADLALQMGHLAKVAGQPDEALLCYRRALALRPGWIVAEIERDALLQEDAGRAPA